MDGVLNKEEVMNVYTMLRGICRGILNGEERRLIGGRICFGVVSLGNVVVSVSNYYYIN